MTQRDRILRRAFRTRSLRLYNFSHDPEAMREASESNERYRAQADDANQRTMREAAENNERLKLAMEWDHAPDV